jgi:hypothetical protein
MFGVRSVLLCPAGNAVDSPAVFVLFTLLSRFAENDKPASMNGSPRRASLVVFHDIEPLKIVFHDFQRFFKESTLGNRISEVEAGFHAAPSPEIDVSRFVRQS